MKISNLQVNVCTQSLSPTLQLYVNIEFSYKIEVPVSITGRILSDNSKIISYISEHHKENGIECHLHLLTKAEKEKIKNENTNENYSTYLSAELSPKAIEHIEIMREKNPEKSVQFRIEFIIKYMEIGVEPEDLHKGSLIKFSIKKISENFEIKQSDWIQKYAPYIGIGKYLLFEFVIPNENKIPSFWKIFYDDLSQTVINMEDSLRNGDWQKTMFFARFFYENSKIGDDKIGHQEFKNEFTKLMLKDQHCEKGINELYNGIWQFFEFYSKYVHNQDKQGNSKPIPVSRKEDAYFAYSTAIGLLNLIGSKIKSD